MAIGVAFVVLASVALALTLIAILIWALYVVITTFAGGRNGRSA